MELRMTFSMPLPGKVGIDLYKKARFVHSGTFMGVVAMSRKLSRIPKVVRILLNEFTRIRTPQYK